MEEQTLPPNPANPSVKLELRGGGKGGESGAPRVFNCVYWSLATKSDWKVMEYPKIL